MIRRPAGASIMATPRSVLSRSSAGLVLAVSSVLLAACKEQPTQSVEDVRRAFVAAATSPAQQQARTGGLGVLSADRVDRATMDLLDVRFETADGRMLHASRAAVMIDPKDDTIRLKLFDVTAVVLGDVGQSSEMVTVPELLTDTWPAGVDVVER